MPRIFISYRRDDTDRVVSRLYDALLGAYGKRMRQENAARECGKRMRGQVSHCSIQVTR